MIKHWMRLIDRMIGAAEAEASLEEGRKRIRQHEVAEAAWKAKMCEYAAAEREMGARARSLVNEFRQSLTK